VRYKGRADVQDSADAVSDPVQDVTTAKDLPFPVLTGFDVA